MNSKHLLTAACLVAAATAPALHAQDFWVIGQGYTPTAISDTGVVAGVSDALGQYFTWTAAGGIQSIGGYIPSLPGGGGQASISNDGTRVGGSNFNTVSGMAEMGYYDVNAGAWNNLGGIGGSSDGGISSGWGISGDGQHAVGLGWVDAGTAHAIQWSQGAGTFDLGSTVADRSSRANAVNGDGRVVVGWQDNETGFRQGAVWVDQVQTTIFDNDGFEVQEASAVSDDGQWVTGIANGTSSWRYNTFTQEFSYIEGLEGDFFIPTAYGSDISNDGRTIIGAVGGFGPPFQRQGYIWREGVGTMHIGAFLAANGVVFEDGFSFFGPFAMSNDGNTFTGWGFGAEGIVGWVATVPAPTPLSLIGFGALAVSRRRRR